MPGPDVVVSRNIASRPEILWALITDLPRMGEWSPENDGGTWLGGVTAAAVGARFKGVNSNGKKRWTTMCRVVECHEPKRFAFDVSAVGLPIARWTYEIVPDGEGSTVTETWTDRRGRIAGLLGGPASGVKDRASHNRTTMEDTLESLATAAES